MDTFLIGPFNLKIKHSEVQQNPAESQKSQKRSNPVKQIGRNILKTSFGMPPAFKERPNTANISFKYTYFSI